MRANQRQRAATRLILTRSTKEKACATARADNKAFTGATHGVVIGRKESNKSGQGHAVVTTTDPLPHRFHVGVSHIQILQIFALAI